MKTYQYYLTFAFSVTAVTSLYPSPLFSTATFTTASRPTTARAAGSRVSPPVERGRVSVLKDGIVTILLLKHLKAGELVFIQTDPSTTGSDRPPFIRALILNLNENNSQGILLGNERLVKEGALVFRSHSLFKLKCSLGLFGQVLDGLGDNKLPSKRTFRESSSLVEQKATGIIDREPVRIPLRTGIKSIDSLIPIGRGQRELIIGDRQTGKSSVALDAILNHVKLNARYKFNHQPSSLSDLRNIVWFVYNAIGQKQSTVNQFKSSLLKYDAFWFTAIVASTAAESAPLQFLSPYTACTLGEFIRDVVGGHCTIIYDDLSKHAVAYRQMSLLLRRPPGREAFPGDVFYVHSRLLERAGSLTITPRQVRGTLTAFPVIETQAGDVSAYIPTNVISITDGQIFLETELFYRGIRPAVNVGLSVSRVGSAAQPGIMKKVAGSLKMELAQYREIEGFSKLGASLDEQTQRILNRGENLIEILKQNLHQPLTTLEQVLSIYLGVGYSGSWFQEVLRLKVKRGLGLGLISRTRVRSSWLEWFRLLSVDFNVFQLAPFVSSLLQFATVAGVVSLNLYNRAENSLLQIFKIFPVLFFDDFVVSFLRELSVLNASTVSSPDFVSAQTSLYRLRFAKNVVVQALLPAAVRVEVTPVSSLKSTLNFCSIRGLVVRVLKRSASAKSLLSRQVAAVLTRWTKQRLFGKGVLTVPVGVDNFATVTSSITNLLEIFINFGLSQAHSAPVSYANFSVAPQFKK
jgi:F-type H+-transporting ATPase subunit alpha